MSLTTEGPRAAEEPGEARPVTALQSRPASVPVRLAAPVSEGMSRRFNSSDPSPGLDIARRPALGRLMRDRRFQFLLILPNQIVFWTVIFVGLLGTAVPGLNFATAITWYVWFCLVFVMMVVVGRAWCSMCPFGGFAEWVQRRTLFRRTQKALGLGLKFPEPLARLGFLIPVASFLLLTWIEEFFNIAGPGNPADTSFMVIGIVASALIFFLVFERRTFCRYICPLTTLIGTVGSMGSVAGFRTRDRQTCLSCKTKDCMRGSDNGYGCPWYTWPGSADSNLYCGLCTECFKSCPEGNIGLFLQKPLTSVISPARRRGDVAWGVALLWGLVLYQQFNATNIFNTIDNKLNSAVGFPHYPNPVDYLGLIALGALTLAGAAFALSRLFGKPALFAKPSLPAPAKKASFIDNMTPFRAFFLPVAYGLIPVVGADYFARQLPKFFHGSPRVLPAAAHIFGFASTKSPFYSASLLGDNAIVITQVVVIAVGTLAALWSTWRLAGRELAPVSRSATGARIASLAFVAACGAGAALLYVLMHAAN
ncbi:MAG TPA: 4Fe-4S binding protein [Acidimicrobiales bacterium]|nr:4Fe-4S binding protein [Acidimicrobiales bacterium]